MILRPFRAAIAGWPILAFALVISTVAGVASAQIGAQPGGEVREDLPTPKAPPKAPQQGMDAVRRELSNPQNLQFRMVKAKAVAQVQRGALAPSIDGPVSIICGQYAWEGNKGAYAWFFVAIKRDQVLWTTLDQPDQGDGDAYLGCRGAGLAK
jgi:hypothetical protein